MLSIHTKIDRAQRLVEMLESDAPRLAMRVAPLYAEHQTAARDYAAQLASHARAELQRLMDEGALWDADTAPQAAD